MASYDYDVMFLYTILEISGFFSVCKNSVPIGMGPIGSHKSYRSQFWATNVVTPVIFGLFGRLLYKMFFLKWFFGFYWSAFTFIYCCKVYQNNFWYFITHLQHMMMDYYNNNA
jgi:hypothetical protein